MPQTKTRRRIVPPPAHITDSPASLCDAADALFRCTAECCRQHKRYARLIGIAVMPEEQEAAARIVAVCDEELTKMVEVYHSAAGHSEPNGDNAWRHCANMLWHASREYLRHHRGAEIASRALRSHSSEKLGELAIEYELEASALLALRQAVESYRRIRPAADGSVGSGTPASI
jgi:hypothetical protein